MLLSKKLLNQQAKALVAAGALAVLTLAALPGVAEAQQEEGAQNAQPSAEPATTVQAIPKPVEQVVVNPGDSLWSISQRKLGPNATPEQIATEVEQTFELNRERIGDDPNLIRAGQKLLLPPAPEPMNGAAFNTPAASEPAGQASSDKPAEPTANEPAVEASPEPAASEPAEPVASEPATSDSEPAAAASTGSAFGLSERQLLGLGIILLSLIVALLILWKAPLRRAVRRGTWPSEPVKPSGVFSSESLTNGRPGGPYIGLAATALSKRNSRLRHSKTTLPRRTFHGQWASAAYSPPIRRALRRAAASEAPPGTGGAMERP